MIFWYSAKHTHYHLQSRRLNILLIINIINDSSWLRFHPWWLKPGNVGSCFGLFADSLWIDSAYRKHIGKHIVSCGLYLEYHDYDYYHVWSWIGIGKVVKRWWYRVLFGLLAELNFVGDNDDIVIIVNIIIHIQTVALFTDIYNKKKLFTDMTLIPGSSLWQPTGHLSSLLHLGRLLLQVKHKGSADHRYKKH